ncbi:H(+)-transporting V1 sector ATPase subunit H [Entophlyctis sp. JEL0112]|nr:H(+)-transporting V1 sector ATPase subunit H [Entophlyctis sp. JEL0112]
MNIADKENSATIDIAPVVAGHNKYLEDQTAAVRAKAIPWEASADIRWFAESNYCFFQGYQKAGLITEDELSQIRLGEKADPSANFKEIGAKYALLLLSLLQKLSRNDTIHNILVSFEDKILGFTDRDDILSQLDSSLLFGTFLNLLKKDDEYIQLKSAKIFAVLAMERDPSLQPVDASSLFAWFSVKVMDSNSNVLDIVIQIMQTTLAIPSYRLPFYETPNAMTGYSLEVLFIFSPEFSLIEAIKASSNAQMQYQGIYCLWTLTFVHEVSADIQRTYEIIPLFIDIAKAAIKEKVVRVIFATVKNMLILAPQENIIPMLGNKLLNLCETLSARKWTDTEITDDLSYIKEELAKNINSLSTFDEYASEVRSGKLDWSPSHLRQYVKYVPAGKKFVQENGTKAQIMQLMTHENSDVRYQALLAVQKLMANAWIS